MGHVHLHVAHLPAAIPLATAVVSPMNSLEPGLQYFFDCHARGNRSVGREHEPDEVARSRSHNHVPSGGCTGNRQQRASKTAFDDDVPDQPLDIVFASQRPVWH
jgi:hypothetical protein